MVFIIVKQKSRNYLFVLSIALTFLVLALLTPVVFNFEEYLNIGYFRTDKDYRIDYSDGYGEVNMDMQLEHSRNNRYSYYLSCSFSSGEAVEIVGMTHLNYTIRVEGFTISTGLYDYDPPTVQYTHEATALLDKNKAFTWSGYAEVKFISNSIVQNETIEFSLSIIIALGNQDYSNFDLISYVVFFSWILAFLVVPLTLKFFIQPQFGISWDAETRKKQKKYFDYFKKSQEEEETR